MPPTLMVQFCSAARIVYAGFGCGCVVLGVVTADNPLWLRLVLVMVILVVVVVPVFLARMCQCLSAPGHTQKKIGVAQ